MTVYTTAERPTEATHDHKLDLLGLPAELQLAICRLITDSTPWDLAIHIIKTKGPDTSEAEISKPVVALRRSPPCKNTTMRSFAQTCRQLYNLTRQRFLNPWIGYTGRLLTRDPGLFDRTYEDRWFDDQIVPFLESELPVWVREQTKMMGVPWNIFDQPCGHWWDIAATIRKNFCNAQALEIHGDSMYSENEDGTSWLQSGVAVDGEHAVRDMKGLIECMSADNTSFKQRLVESNMQLCMIYAWIRDETLHDWGVDGKVKWMKNTYVFGGFNSEGEAVATFREINAWVGWRSETTMVAAR